jgi:hypothetical protein
LQNIPVERRKISQAERRFRKYHGTEEKKLNPHANTPAAVKINEINPKYENTPAINQSKCMILI